MNIEGRCRAGFAAIAVATALLGCRPDLEIGDSGKARQNKTLVENFNSSIKARCTIHKDETVNVINFSTLSFGSSDGVGIVQLSSKGCVGWTINDSSLNDLFK